MAIRPNPHCCPSSTNCGCCTNEIIGVNVTVTGASTTECETTCDPLNGSFFIPVNEGGCGGTVTFPMFCMEHVVEFGFVGGGITCGPGLMYDKELRLSISVGTVGDTDQAQHTLILEMPSWPLPADCSPLKGALDDEIHFGSEHFCDVSGVTITAEVIVA